MFKILIVEDEKPINDLIKFNLELSGYQCDQVFDGEEALCKTFSNHYDLVILDVMLPTLSGFDVIKELHGTPVISSLPKPAFKTDSRDCNWVQMTISPSLLKFWSW